MCLWLCTASVHNTTHNSSDNLPSLHCWDHPTSLAMEHVNTSCQPRCQSYWYHPRIVGLSVILPVSISEHCATLQCHSCPSRVVTSASSQVSKSQSLSVFLECVYPYHPIKPMQSSFSKSVLYPLLSSSRPDYLICYHVILTAGHWVLNEPT